jgi:hypothetical protein
MTVLGNIQEFGATTLVGAGEAYEPHGTGTFTVFDQHCRLADSRAFLACPLRKTRWFVYVKLAVAGSQRCSPILAPDPSLPSPNRQLIAPTRRASPSSKRITARLLRLSRRVKSWYVVLDEKSVDGGSQALQGRLHFHLQCYILPAQAH